MRRAGMTALMTLLVTAGGCPVPTDFQTEPVPPNYPPVVDAERTTSYNQAEVVPVNTRPIWNLWVDEPNVGDTLDVKVVKDLHLAIAGAPATVLLDSSVGPSDVPPPEEGAEPSVRTKQLELAFSPCTSGEEGTEVLMTVCISDRGFQNVSATATQKNPCLPSAGGYMTSYTVIANCTAAQ